MKTYEQKLVFFKHVTIQAENAKEANEKLDELINEIEWSADVSLDDSYKFEDEPVDCPECRGKGYVTNEDDEEEKESPCVKCKGEGVIVEP